RSACPRPISTPAPKARCPTAPSSTTASSPPRRISCSASTRTRIDRGDAAMDVVTLDAQAGDNGLAMMLQGLLAENLAASADKRSAFESMTSTFGIVAPDAEVTVTLAFASGRCTIYDGLRHEPDLVITADSAKIPEMSLLSIRYGMP